jgi:hypothetical protein
MNSDSASYVVHSLHSSTDFYDGPQNLEHSHRTQRTTLS